MEVICLDLEGELITEIWFEFAKWVFRSHSATDSGNIGQIAQILLLILQYKALPKEARKHGLRPLIRDVVRTVARLTCSSRKWKLLFAKTIFRLDWVWVAAQRLALATSPPLFSV